MVCRFVHDAATMLLWGAFAYLAGLVPRDLRRAMASRLQAFRVCAVALAVVTVAAALPLEAAAIGEGWGDALDPTTLRAILFETSLGMVWLPQAGLAVLLAGTLAFGARWRLSATAIAAGLLLASLALTGHAAMHEGPAGIAHRVNDALHVLAAGAWLGALVPLPAILAALDDPQRGREAAIAVRRFSSAGHAAVALALVTGLVNTALVLKRWPADWSSPYQALLAMKIALVLTMVLLALANRYLLVPRLGGSSARSAAVRLIRRSAIAEIGLGLVVVGCVAIFGMLEPA